MSEVHVHRVQPAWKKNALIDNDTYLKWYADSVKNPDKFWGKHGKRIDWFKPFSKVKNTSFNGIDLPPRRPSSAVMTKVDLQSSMRPASASGEKPPKTIEWMAPMRVQASIA